MKPKMDYRIKRPFAYTPASATQISATFARIRAEQRRNSREVEQKITPLQRKVGTA